jgi:pimeloyl-ACP methyl ester carboxylesterase
VFSQSDLGFESYYAGAPGATHYKGEEIDWSFTAINNGVTNATIVDYKIVLSQDQTFDVSDILLKEGNIAENWLNFTGLDVGQTINHSSVNKGRIQIPLNIEANRTYYFIFWIEQDIDGGETNVSNNIVTQSVFISFANHVTIEEVNQDELGIKKPLLLVHGWQPKGKPAAPDTTIWNNFVGYFVSQQELFDNYKLYYVKYKSNFVSVDDIGHELRYDLDAITEFQGKQLSIVAHSMGGLVARSFAKRSISTGFYANQKGGERVEKLITLGTPHHGSPIANGDLRFGSLTPAVANYLGNFDFIFYSFFGPGVDDFNRSDLVWDNFDNFFDYTGYENEYNHWLNSNKMNGDTTNYFDDKIIAYSGIITKQRFDNKYSLGEAILLDMGLLGYLSDGIVPKLSASFSGHTLLNRRSFYEYFHDEIATGKENEDLDGGLFHTIKTDLLDFTDTPILLSTSTSTLQFPEVLENTTYQKTFNLSNTGSMDLTVSSIDITGVDLNQFSIISPTAPFNIVVNDSINVVVQFNPTSVGDKNVLLTIANNSVNSPTKEINLNGNGVDTATSILAFSPNTSYDFKDVYIYGGSTSNPFVILNQGTSDITISNIEVTGVDASLFSILNTITFPVVVKSGTYGYIHVSFQPDSLGVKNAELVITNDSSNSPNHSISLTGTGTDVSNNPNANKITSYEYWFDNDYASKVSTSVVATATITINPNINTGNISEGLHIFHIRFKDSHGHWSSVMSDYIFKQTVTNPVGKMIEYEYWFDNDYASRVSNTVEATSTLTISPNINTANISEGLHIFHIRFKDNNEQWSSIMSDFIFREKIQASNNLITSYRYWFNTDDTQMTNVDVSPDINTLNLDELIDTFSLVPNGNNFIHFQFKDINGSWSSVTNDEIIVDIVYPKVFLQGPYDSNTGLMIDNLRSTSNIPITSPYIDVLIANSNVFDTGGSSGIGLSRDDIIDWVWVELRDSSDGTTVIESKSALLQRDGDIVGVDGTSALSFGSSNGNYYLMISHRNHIGILTASVVSLTAGTLNIIDLRSNTTLITGGTNGIFDMGDGNFALFAGDFNGDGQIQNSDKNAVEPLRGLSGYNNADIDMNNEVQNTDINNVLNPNIGRGEQFARRNLKLYAKRSNKNNN